MFICIEDLEKSNLMVDFYVSEKTLLGKGVQETGKDFIPSFQIHFLNVYLVRWKTRYVCLSIRTACIRE